uniref:GG11890 n=1 Tax=Drosophila erecta TaxID=7220 RepID=B3P251_DROER
MKAPQLEVVQDLTTDSFIAADSSALEAVRGPFGEMRELAAQGIDSFRMPCTSVV